MHEQNEKLAISLREWWEEAGVDAGPPLRRSSKQANPDKVEQQTRSAPIQNVGAPPPDRLAAARQLAASAKSLDDLTRAIGAFDAGALSDAATQAVIARGNPQADIMLIGEAPGREEDVQGKPFVGRSGQFLDQMFAAIGLGEDQLYITNGVFWRPRNNRTPTPQETAMCLPFVERHIALVQPKVLISIGGSSSKTLLGLETGITRLRGRWSEYQIRGADGAKTGQTIALLPMYHPAFVLRKPVTKRECWQDLQSLREKLAEL